MTNEFKKTIFLLTLLLTQSAAMLADLPAQQQDDNGKVMYLRGLNNSGFNIHINYNNDWLQTTYGDYGYQTVISFDGGRTRKGIGFNDADYWGTGNFEFGKTYTVNGIEVTLVGSIPDANTGAVTVKYYVTNTTTTVQSFRLGTYADTQVGNNDRCNVYQEGAQTVVMEHDNSSSPQCGAVYKITAITPFDTMWFGNWQKQILPTKTFVSGYEYTPGEDSAIAWSWNITLQPGESTMRAIGTGETVQIFNRSREIDLDVPAFLGKDANGYVNGTATDLYEFLQYYMKDSPAPYYIRLRLESNARYVISQPLEVNTAIIIEGMDAKYPATIDASGMTGPFVQITNSKAAALTNIKDFYTTMYDVTFRNLIITGLKGQLFNTNGQRFLIPYFTVDNCSVRQQGASSKPVFDFSGGGYVEEMNITNSTFSADDATTWGDGGFFNAQGGTTKDDCFALYHKLTMANSTLYNISKGKTTSVLAENSKDYISFVLQDNIIINSGKKGQFVIGMNNGVSSSLPYRMVKQNSFLWTTDNDNYEDVGAMEKSYAPNNVVGDNIECNDIIGYSGSTPIIGITVDKLFSNSKEAVSDGDFSLADCPQKEAQIGDPRWLFPSKLEKYITYDMLDSDKDLGKTINGFIKDGFSQFVLEDNAQYEIRQTIVADKGLLIKGNNVTIHAFNTNGPLIQLNENPKVEVINDYYRFNEVTLKGLHIDGIKNSLFYDSNLKCCVVKFTIDDCVLALETESVKNDAFISFQGGGVKDFTVKNSTIYGNGSGAKYFVRYNNSARIDRFGFETSEHTTVNYDSNTFYKVNTGNWANYAGICNYTQYSVIKNIWMDCGDGAIARRILGNGRLGTDASAVFDRNTYLMERTPADQGDYDQSGTILTTDPGFKKPDEGDFTLCAYSDQASECTGDPRWYVNGVHYYTGIDEVNAENVTSHATVYDLQGRRVQSMDRKGVYIVNGKKIFVK